MASHHSIHSHATEDSEVSSSDSEYSQEEGDGAEEEDNAKEDKGRIKTSSDGQEASDGEECQEHPHTQDTLTGVSQLLSKHEDTDPESDPGKKVLPAWQSSTRMAQKRIAPRKTPTNHHLPRRSHQPMRHSMTGPGKKRGCWTHALMLDITTKLPTTSQAGQQGTP